MSVVDPIAILAQVCLVCVEALVVLQPSCLWEGKADQVRVWRAGVLR